MLKIAAIGLGARALVFISKLCSLEPDLQLVGIVDPQESLLRKQIDESKISAPNLQFYPCIETLLADASKFDGVVIGTRCHLHTPLAVQVAACGLPLFLEKPVAITDQQITQLSQAFQGKDSQVVVSFPLRVSPLYQAARAIILSGRLGTINQIQAFNDVTYGGVYFGQWYRSASETGGLWLQKATHDFDCINHLANAMPTNIAAMTSQCIYGGDKPYDLQCKQCDEQNTCVESTKNQLARNDKGALKPECPDDENDHYCMFSQNITHQDAGSAIIRYHNGIHANYTQNFVVRRDAFRRGARVIGHQATLDFDWYTQKIRVIDHHGNKRVDEISVEAASSHNGGDSELAKNFINVIRGVEQSKTTLAEGLLSATMCLAARKSSRDQTFEKIKMPASTADPLFTT